MPQEAPTGRSGVQSLQRAFDLLEHLADAGGEMGLSQLAAVAGLPQPTIHRLIRTLVEMGYVRQQPSRRYALGARLIRLGDTANRYLGQRARPVLADLVAATGETANLATLDGDRVVYLAQVPSPHAMRMFTEVGRRVLPHCTGVGKALLAQLPATEAHGILARTGMPAMTEHTITDLAEFDRELDRVRAAGYAIDEGEQEVGVRCVAAPVLGAPMMTALSVSGPEGRLTRQAAERIAPALCSAAERLAADIAAGN
ncbi:IclR family transcriptional regulator [Micromonospora sp. NPDC020750]|uniref:IclR family transcriptional regulator n=1 Tax=unclassified Micromonospora TaxID=2617518 RepID=UPI0037A2153D